jgi:DNA-directed RNA polymerase subunit RPC12/RpoP
VHSAEKPFKCSVCGKGVNTKQHLKRHEVVHTKSFKCEYEGCLESFYKHQSLRHHVNSVHLKTLTCKDCGKTFQKPSRLENHKAKHHGLGPAYECNYTGCFQTFKVWSALQLHMKTEHSKLKCDICGKGCLGDEGLRMHMMIHDEEKSIKLWKCSECSKEFLKKEGLLLHCKNDHEFVPNSVQKFITDNDAKILNTFKVNTMVGKGNNAVDLLLNTVAPQKTISCTFKSCTRVFKKDYDLKRHLIWHQKQKEIIMQKLQEVEARKSEQLMAEHLLGINETQSKESIG